MTKNIITRILIALMFINTILAILVLLGEISFISDGGQPGLTTALYGLPINFSMAFVIEKLGLDTDTFDLFKYWYIVLLIDYVVYTLILGLLFKFFKKKNV